MTSRLRLGDALPSHLPAEAHLLGRCVARGLPSAGGAVVLDTSAGTDARLAGRLGPLPPGAVDLHMLGRRTFVRDLPVADTAALAAGLRTAFALGGPVLVQPQVGSVHGGVAALRRASSDDVVRAVEGRPHEVDTADGVRTLHVPVLRARWQRPHRGSDPWRTPLPPWGMRLSRLLRGVRAVLQEGDLDVEWADDGRTCRLLSVRRRS